MCGITGCIDLTRSTPDETLTATITRMADTMTRRGPDDRDTWTDPRAGIALGFRRLAIIDLSTTGRQPMQSTDGRYVIVFNGEIYNYPTLRTEAEAQGQRFRGSSDTEVALAGIKLWGLRQAVTRFNGMFAFALWDRHTGTLHLVRDRMGIKPLYYGRLGHHFVFGSELKPIRTHPAFSAPLNRAALALYLRYSYIPAPHCIYAELHKLMPGHILTLTPNTPHSTPTIEPYWTLQSIAEQGVGMPFKGSSADAAAALDRLLRSAVQMRMVADVPLGAFLSGGIDSSTVTALMQAQSNYPVKTFTIGNPSAEYDEAPYARQIAAHLGTDHTELYISPEEARAVIPRLPTLYDEPFSDASQIPTLLVAELAHRRVTVSLSGDGGDELFAGYNRHRLIGQMGRIPRTLRRGAARLLTRLAPGTWDHLYRALPIRRPQQMPGDRLHKLAGVLMQDGAQDMYRHLVSTWQQPTALLPGVTEPPADAWPALPNLTQQMMYLDTIGYLPGDILTKLDRASMGVSLEARVPLLDHRVVAFAWRLPMSMLRKDGQSKWLLRQVLYNYVPPELVERPKMGFAIPLDAWLRGPLRGWAEDLLAPARLRHEGYLDPAPIQEMLKQHLGGRRNRQYQLWNVLMFQAWLDAWG